jgi:hypothetical protein
LAGTDSVASTLRVSAYQSNCQERKSAASNAQGTAPRLLRDRDISMNLVLRPQSAEASAAHPAPCRAGLAPASCGLRARTTSPASREAASAFRLGAAARGPPARGSPPAEAKPVSRQPQTSQNGSAETAS